MGAGEIGMPRDPAPDQPDLVRVFIHWKAGAEWLRAVRFTVLRGALVQSGLAVSLNRDRLVLAASWFNLSFRDRDCIRFSLLTADDGRRIVSQWFGRLLLQIIFNSRSEPGRIADMLEGLA